MRRIVVVAVPPVMVFDLSIPETVFPAVLIDGSPVYEVTVCTPSPGSVTGLGGLSVVVRHGLDVIEDADTVIVTGTGAREGAPTRVLDALRQAAAGGKRVASICTGAFVLAQAGLLDGRPATTYWKYSGEMRARFPTLAARARTSTRTLTRRFLAETGLSPLQWLLHQRVDRARELLGATDLPVGQVARRSGLGTAESLRQHLMRRNGMTPSAYRSAFTRRVVR